MACEDGLGVQVALGRGLAPEGVGLVGQPHVERVPVEVGVDGHGGHPQLAAGPDDPDGDLSPVGDENLLQHAAPFESDGHGAAVQPPRGDITLSRPVGCVPCRAPGSPTSGASTRSTRPTATCSTRPAQAPPTGVVAVADHQTAGRGRLGRRWEAPPGSNLLMSVLLRPDLPAGQRQLASGVVALAAVDAVEAVTGLRRGDQVAERPARTGRPQAGRGAGRGRSWSVRPAGGRPPSSDRGRDRDQCELARGTTATSPTSWLGSATSLRQQLGRPVDRSELLDALLDALGPRAADLERTRAGPARPPTSGPGAPRSEPRCGWSWPTRCSRGWPPT